MPFDNVPKQHDAVNSSPDRSDDSSRVTIKDEGKVAFQQLPQEAFTAIGAMLLESERYVSFGNFRLGSREVLVATKLVAKRFVLTDGLLSSLEDLAGDPNSQFTK
jgi:hypothetical protein